MRQLLILTAFSFILISCNNDRAEIKLSDFSDKKVVTLKPYKRKPYAKINIEVKGYVNDTVKIIQGSVL